MSRANHEDEYKGMQPSQLISRHGPTSFMCTLKAYIVCNWELTPKVCDKHKRNFDLFECLGVKYIKNVGYASTARLKTSTMEWANMGGRHYSQLKGREGRGQWVVPIPLNSFPWWNEMTSRVHNNNERGRPPHAPNGFGWQRRELWTCTSGPLAHRAREWRISDTRRENHERKWPHRPLFKSVGCFPWQPCDLRATSRVRLKARDHYYTLQALSLVEKVEPVQVRCFTLRLRDQWSRAQHFVRICTHTQTTPISSYLCPPMCTHSTTCVHPCPPMLFKLRPCIQTL